MKRHFDVAIVGGGIIGSSIAYYLAKEGISVLMLERDKVASGATSAAAGMLGAQAELEENDAFFRFAKESQTQYVSLNEELRKHSGVDIQLVNNGMYKVALTDNEAVSLKQMAAASIEMDWHSRDEVNFLEPHIANNIKGGLHIPSDGHVSPIHLCTAFSKSASLLGASLLEHTSVHAVERNSPSDYTVKTSAGDFHCQSVVITNGTWSGYFLNQLGLDNDIVPVKGECLSVTSREVYLSSTIFHNHCYVVPKGDGRFVVGATMVPDDWSMQPTVGGIHSLIEKIRPVFPKIDSCNFQESWAGLRPQTRDGRPYIGRHPSDENLYFATGHYRNGILLAPQTGILIRDLIMKKRIKSEYIEAFRVDRLLEVKA
ncbi:glycine oxidase ThiO [Metabacillus herbersteinensis]|uniref:glycine oxidase n=1 Tax=Metabacillus herbersteinensis TaxID=283816 RepID=A0ABV6GE41_9BACI